MTKPILTVLAALSLGLAAATASPPVFAQFAPAHAHGGGKMKKMADALGLTDAQKAQIKPILQGARQQAQALKANTTLTPEARKAQMKELARSTRQQVMAILTPAQRAKMKAMKQNHQ